MKKAYKDAYELACSIYNAAYDLANGDEFEIDVADRIFTLSIDKAKSDYNNLLDDVIKERSINNKF